MIIFFLVYDLASLIACIDSVPDEVNLIFCIAGIASFIADPGFRSHRIVDIDPRERQTPEAPILTISRKASEIGVNFGAPTEFEVDLGSSIKEAIPALNWKA